MTKASKMRRKKFGSLDGMMSIIFKSRLSYLARLDLEGESMIRRGYGGLKRVVFVEVQWLVQ